MIWQQQEDKTKKVVSCVIRFRWSRAISASLKRLKIDTLLKSERGQMAPLDTSAMRSLHADFELLYSDKSNGVIPVSKYKSSKTGLTVVIAGVESPIVDGYFCLATEAYDDDGLPHTLEHLVFLGSEEYPYKGILDLLANRCLASGTNAWTDTDHTVYTMTTAGSEGFLSLMPIYLDHILYPTLTEAAYTTEVHHVTGKGEDAGVVYCEMQGRENTGESLTHLALLRALYPGHCGYKSETGGALKELRTSTSNEKVKEFHKKFYRPENLSVIIAGQVKPDAVFAALAPLEAKIIAKGDRESFERPWQSPIPPFTAAVDQEVLYPCEEENHGMVLVGWRGPSAVTEVYKITSFAVLLKYLSDTPVSPLQQIFVETEDSYASTVSHSIIENSTSLVYFNFYNVPIGKIDLVKEKLEEYFKGLANGSERIDMNRMQTLIHKHRQETLMPLETNPHDAVAFMLIGDMLYGNTKDDLHQRLNSVEDLDKMALESHEFWIDLIKTYLVDAPSATIRGKPSVSKLEQMTAEEQKRVEDQRSKLGEEGLKEKQRILEESHKANQIPPPESMLTCVNIPSTDSITYHQIKRYVKGGSSHPNMTLDNVPVYTQVDDVHTNFVYLYALLDTADVPIELRPYLRLLVEVLLESPIQREERLVPYEEILAELERDTIYAKTMIGLESGSRFSCGLFSSTVTLKIQCEPHKIKRCIEWIHEILYKTVLTAERIKTVATKMTNDVARVKRSGPKVLETLVNGICYRKGTNHDVTSMLRQHKVLSALLEKLKSDDKAAAVIADIEKLRQLITDPNRVAIHIGANLDKLPSHVDCGETLTALENIIPRQLQPGSNKLHVTHDWKLQAEPSECEVRGCLVGVGCVESAFLTHNVPCINDPTDADLPKLMVFLQYLSLIEGPMWKQIRGQGYSYSYRINSTTSDGMLSLALFRATNPVAAFKEAKSIVENFIEEDAEFDQTLLESARSSLIFKIIDLERSVGELVTLALLCSFKGVSLDHNKTLIKRISEVTVKDLRQVGKYVRPLFSSDSSRTAVVCHTSKVEEYGAEFKELGVSLKVYPTLDDSFLNKP